MAPGSKLTFKGESKKKKKTKHSTKDPVASGSGSKQAKEPREGWIVVEFPEQAHGPLYLVLPSSTDGEGVQRPPLCLTVNQTLATKVFPHVLTEEQSPEEPDDISQVVSGLSAIIHAYNITLTSNLVGVLKSARV